MFLASISSFSLLRSVFLDRVIHFGETLGEQVKDRSPNRVESLIEVPNVVHVKVHVPSFNMILSSTPSSVLTLNYRFLQNVVANGKGSFSEKAQCFNRGSLSMSSESTCF